MATVKPLPQAGAEEQLNKELFMQYPNVPEEAPGMEWRPSSGSLFVDSDDFDPEVGDYSDELSAYLPYSPQLEALEIEGGKLLDSVAPSDTEEKARPALDAFSVLLKNWVEVQRVGQQREESSSAES